MSFPHIHGTVKTARMPQYPDPINVDAGEILVLGKTDPEWPGWQWCTDVRGKAGWVPMEYIQKEGNATTGVVRCSYTAKELPIVMGQKILILLSISGWYWASNEAGETGWIPASHVLLNDREAAT
jgi:Variant SH3 domain